MLNSRDITLLRDDVEANCRVFLTLCEAAGLQVLVTQTVRDEEYQAQLYAQGRTAPGSIVTNSKTTTFHGAGLAFDIGRRFESGYQLQAGTSVCLSRLFVSRALVLIWCLFGA